MILKYFSRCFLLITSLVITTHIHASTIFEFSDGLISGVTGLDTTEGIWNATFNDIDISEATVQADDATAMLLSDALASFIQTSIYSGDASAFIGCDATSTCFLSTVTGLEIFSETSRALEGYSVFIGESAPGGATSSSFTGGGGVGDYIGSFVAWDRVSEVPIPAAVWLFGSGLIGLIGVTKRNKV